MWGPLPLRHLVPREAVQRALRRGGSRAPGPWRSPGLSLVAGGGGRGWGGGSSRLRGSRGGTWAPLPGQGVWVASCGVPQLEACRGGWGLSITRVPWDRGPSGGCRGGGRYRVQRGRLGVLPVRPGPAASCSSGPVSLWWAVPGPLRGLPHRKRGLRPLGGGSGRPRGQLETRLCCLAWWLRATGSPFGLAGASAGAGAVAGARARARAFRGRPARASSECSLQALCLGALGCPPGTSYREGLGSWAQDGGALASRDRLDWTALDRVPCPQRGLRRSEASGRGWGRNASCGHLGHRGQGGPRRGSGRGPA